MGMDATKKKEVKQPSETRVKQEIELAVSSYGARVYNNPTGNVTKDNIGDRRIVYGLLKGSSDLIAIVPIKITQNMVGKTLGVFSAFEVKRTKDQSYGATTEQKNFIKVIKSKGGIAGVVYGPDDAIKLIEGKKNEIGIQRVV